MIEIYCFRCSQRTISPDGVRCLSCDYIEKSRIPISANFQPQASDGNVSTGYYLPASNARSQTTDDDFLRLEPTQDARTRKTDPDFNYLAQIVGCHGSVDAHKINYPSQVRVSPVFDQNSAENQSLLAEHLNINKDNLLNTNIDRCNPIAIEPFLESMNDSIVPAKQRTYLDEQSQSNARQMMPSHDNRFKKQITKYAEEVNEVDKLNSASSISFLSEYSIPESSVYVNTLGDSQEMSSGCVVLAETINNSSISNLFPGNVTVGKTIPEQEIHNSGKTVRKGFKYEERIKRPLTCGKCGKKFLKKSILKIHVENNCDPNPFKCDQCNEKFSSESHLLKHQPVHNAEKPFKCNQCDYTAKWETDLNRHKREVHNSDSLCVKRSLICGKCGKLCRTGSLFNAHLQSNCDLNPHKCHQCNKKFSKENELIRHQSVHNTEKLFQCDECTYASKWKFDLKSHRDTIKIICYNLKL